MNEFAVDNVDCRMFKVVLSEAIFTSTILIGERYTYQTVVFFATPSLILCRIVVFIATPSFILCKE